MDLKKFGWNDYYEEEYEAYKEKGYLPARILIEHRGMYKVITQEDELDAVNAGKLFYELGKEGLPAVGDWVTVTKIPNENKAIIQHVLSRKSAFIRKVAGTKIEGQVVASNFDYVFIVTALNQNFNLKRIERYLTIALESGGLPVIILSKADLCDDVEDKRKQVEAIAFDINIHVISSINHIGLDDLKVYFNDSQTVAILGSSGVGKSTLINYLFGDNILEVNEARVDDDRGRHTTTHRQLVILPEGGLVIDTPGMREIGLWSVSDYGKDGYSDVFTDIEELSQHCKFVDCKHISEPGCAVKQAIMDGELTTERLENYRKLQKEYKFIESKKSEKLHLEEKQRRKAFGKLVKSVNNRR